MSFSLSSVRRRAASVISLVLLAAAMTLVPRAADAAATCTTRGTVTTCTGASVTAGGTSYPTTWYLPDGEATGLVLLEHGFSRSCANLAGTSAALAARGLAVFCLDADMTGGNPSLANALGDALADRSLTLPQGRSLPERYVVGGHSAGGHFAAIVGQRLADRGYPGLRGAVLLDPVAASGYSAALRAISAGGTRQVLAVTSRPSLANLFNNTNGALASLGVGFVGVQLRWSSYLGPLPKGSNCHVDAEGENTNLIGVLGAGCSPTAVQTTRLRTFASAWAASMATGTPQPDYTCTDAAVVSTCGAAVRDLVTGPRPLAALIPTR